MRLIGGKDYYDGATGFDTDTARVFVRENHNTAKGIKIPELNGLYKKIYLKRSFFGYSEAEHYWCISIVFCGRIFNGILYRTYRSDLKWNHPSRLEERMFWHPEPFLEHLSQNGYTLYQGHHSEDRDRVVTQETVHEYFDPQVPSKKILDYLVENNILIAMRLSAHEDNYYSRSRDGTWLVNTDGLKYYSFGSIIDPFTANQELDMFLGTILVKDEDKRVQISDASKAKKHGFDKMSFRNTHHHGKPRNQKKARA